MKRLHLIRFILKSGCKFIREGAKHSVFFNPINNKTTTIPRHNEVNDNLARKICKDLGISFKKSGI